MQNVVASKLFVSTLESYYDNYPTTTVADLDSAVAESCLSGDGRLLVVSDSDITTPAGILVPSAGALATAGSLGMVGSAGFAAAITGDIVLAGDDLDSIPPPPPLLAAESSSSVVTSSHILLSLSPEAVASAELFHRCASFSSRSTLSL